MVGSDNLHESEIPAIKKGQPGDRYSTSSTSKLTHHPPPNHRSQSFNFQRSSTTQSLGKDIGDVSMPTPVLKTQQLTISDQNQVKEYYMTRFKNIDPSWCWVIAKEFIESIDQMTRPRQLYDHWYTAEIGVAPSWWLDTTGRNGVRYVKLLDLSETGTNTTSVLNYDDNLLIL